MKTTTTLILMAVFGASCSTQRSSFDDDFDGWTKTGHILKFEHDKNRGNPSPSIWAQDNEGGDTMTLVAPKKGFGGDLRKYNGGIIAFDVKALDDSYGRYAPGSRFGRVTITSGGGEKASLDLVTENPKDQCWHTYSARLNGNDWGQVESEWTALLSNVTKIEIGFERNAYHLDATAFDNPLISNNPGVICRIQAKSE